MPSSTTYLLESDEDYLKRKRAERKCCGISDCWESCWRKCLKRKEYQDRIVTPGKAPKVQKFPSNAIRNQKYNFFTFFPLVLFDQFKLFFNLVFLLMAISQFIPDLRISALYTYWAPLGFVIFVTVMREMIDDIRRWKRDREINSTKYSKVMRSGQTVITSADIQIGDMIIVHKNQRVPADMILLRTSEKNGSCFIRTDQLDGETDWKLRLAVPTSQALDKDEDLYNITCQIFVEAPNKNIHHFEGVFTRLDGERTEDPLSIENTMWSNTVLASGSAIGVVIYTGAETRAVMNSSQPRSKLGVFDHEVNNLAKLLFATVLGLSLIMIALKGFNGAWFKYLWRYFMLFSYIIPLALRVNMDMAKIVASFSIMRDRNMPGNIVRCTTIPEELGRVSYLMTDKTGTLTQNDMVFKKLHMGNAAYTSETMDEVENAVCAILGNRRDASDSDAKTRQSINAKITEAVLSLALCHNVTPVMEEDDERITYQASSPDEVALVSWTETVGVTLIQRDISSMTLRTPVGSELSYDVLQIFPFTSETKRMGIIVRNKKTNEITFYLKGADAVMLKIVSHTDWLSEECENMAREGLRTLVVARKPLNADKYSDFEKRLHTAKLSTKDRAANVATVIESLECEMETVCLTGVEDKLQDSVRPTLETLRNAGIRVWMLTGDKLETAQCIAQSSRLVSRNQTMYTFGAVEGRMEAHLEMNALRRHTDSALVITGHSLQVCLEYYEHEFVSLAVQCPSVVVCRCSPTQKAEIVKTVQRHTGKVTAAIGDGGNDVSMIQKADVGIGLVGKEGRQASLASDFSLTQFSHVARLFLTHGRYSYKNAANLSQFIIHRGIIISVMQAIFSAVFFFVAISLFPSFLMVGYATAFTMFPVFSLVLDKDVNERVAITYPELYKDLSKGRELTFKTFFIWVLISIYQGAVIMYGALLLFEEDFVHIISIAFTATLLTELLMVALTVNTWHILMLVAEVISLALYIFALVYLKEFFDQDFLRSWNFIWKTAAITSVSCIPLFILKFVRHKLRPPIHSKLQEN